MLRSFFLFLQGKPKNDKNTGVFEKTRANLRVLVITIIWKL
jgi:hypothetical protein